MDWTATDEALYRALDRDAALAADPAARPAVRLRYQALRVETRAGQRDITFWYVKPRQFAQDFAWAAVRLLLIIPVNVVAFVVQLIANLMRSTATLTEIARGTVEVDARGLAFTVDSHAPPLPPIPAADLRTIGCRSNGVLIGTATQRTLLHTDDDPALFVTLAHVAPAARITHPLTGPVDFLDRCRDRGLSVGAAPHAPTAWGRPARRFNAGWAWQRWAGAAITVLLLVTCLWGFTGR